jgi:prepilin-type N-terminal cleavage/methylation domain-containing protein/prepilin-type processing-associated H-X9-DG protein
MHRRNRAFTLVELLVVIGIIALLISILMPSLTRARMSANLVTCQSNFRQIYTAISFYVGENKGVLPRSCDQTQGVEGTFANTLIQLTKLLGKPFNDETTDTLSPVFTCVEANMSGGANVWAPNLIRTVQFNPRAFPGYDQLMQQNAEYPQRRLSSIKNAAEKIAFYEGPQIPVWNMCPEPESIFLDGWRWNWGHWYTDPPKDGDMSRWNSQIDAGVNRDDGWWVCSMRFRHLKNTTTPVAFFDGHVEARKIGEVKVREICINK